MKFVCYIESTIFSEIRLTVAHNDHVVIMSTSFAINIVELYACARARSLTCSAKNVNNKSENWKNQHSQGAHFFLPVITFASEIPLSWSPWFVTNSCILHNYTYILLQNTWSTFALYKIKTGSLMCLARSCAGRLRRKFDFCFGLWMNFAL